MNHHSTQVVLALLIFISATPSQAGSLVMWGDNTTGMQSVPSGSFKQVAVTDCGSGNVHQEFGIAIRDDGTLVGWGNDSVGQTNVPSGTFTDVACGPTFAYGITTAGTVVGWGVNGYGGPVYMPPSNYTYKAVACASSNFEYFLTTDGQVIGLGYGESGQFGSHPGTFTAIAAGDYTSYGLSPGGSLINIRSYPLPSGTFSAIAAGPYNAMALLDDGTLATWGSVTAVASGTFSEIACGLDSAWGGNDNYGQLNVPAGQYSDVAAGGNVMVAITAPEPSTLALLAAGAIGLLGYKWRIRRAQRRAAQPEAQDDAPAILSFPSQSSHQANMKRRAA